MIECYILIILKKHIKDYPKNVINLPKVITFDEFKAVIENALVVIGMKREEAENE